ncbi:heparinase II/III family protein [Undibacterium arcticum]
MAGHFFLFHSSANNHLLGEYMGLFIGATTWPCWDASSRWRRLAQRGLEREALKQNAPDGVNREQGIWYHHEVADMMLLCGLFGRANGMEFSEAYWERLETMLEFVLSVMDVAGNVPMIGDSDDALMVRFFPGGRL